MAKRLGRIDAADVLERPLAVADHLQNRAGIYGLANVTVAHSDGKCTVFHLTLEPWLPMALAGYPVEHVAIGVWSDGRVAASPIDNGNVRSWKHRELDVLRRLCLFFDGDPPELRWAWDAGFVKYVTVVHRHLMAEEFFRRNRRWPVEDVPHGPGYRPIRSFAFQRLVSRRKIMR